MYSDQEDSSNSVWLGVVSRSLHHTLDNDAYRSKLGGQPIWLGDCPNGAPPKCPSCNKPLFLVAQIYCPVNFPRALHIFGCNQASCMKINGSWRVFRTQKAELEFEQEKSVDGGEDAANTICLQPEVGVEAPPVDEEPSSDWGGGWNDDKNEWTQEEDEGDDSWGADLAERHITSDHIDDDIERMLQAQENQITSGSEGPPPEPPAPGLNTGISSVPPPAPDIKENIPDYTFPANEIETIEEPYSSCSICGDDDMLVKLQKYQEEEEDEDILKLISESMMSKKVKSSEYGAFESSCDDGPEDDEDEKRISQGKPFLLFQERLEREPRQVLRYAFEGQPLWSSHSPPSTRNIPPCTCGAPRQFELQLMPSALYHLSTNKIIQANVSGPIQNGNNRVNSKQPSMIPHNPVTEEKGMDWGVVTIWSCPSSCNQSAEEYILIQPALD